MKKSLYILLLGSFSLLLVSCGRNENDIYVAASPHPHSYILEFAKPLLKEKGYNLKIQKYSDYIMPNEALTKKQVDANFFQHEPYLEKYNKDFNTNIVSVAKIHIEPIGIYSKKYTNLDQVEDGAKVSISSSVSDHGRLLNLLVSANLITLKDGVEPFKATLNDIATNPKNLVIDSSVEPETLVSVYKTNQADLILINSNFALDAGLTPGTDSIALESVANNPFANIIATLPEYANSDKIKALIQVLTSKEVGAYILETWNGNIVPFTN